MIIDLTLTKIDCKLNYHCKAFPIREDCTVLPVLGKTRIGWIETPMEECTWVRWEDCPAHIKDIGGWPGGWFAIPTCDLAAGESDNDN